MKKKKNRKKKKKKKNKKKKKKKKKIREKILHIKILESLKCKNKQTDK